MKKYLRDYLFLLLIAGTIIIVDQLTKTWVRETLTVGQIYRPNLWISAYIRIIHWKNTGAAFGMFQNGNTIFMILSSLVSLIILYYFPQVPSQDRIVRFSMAMLLGGAVGNLLDRIQYKYVTDFVSVLDFPVFNVADASISCGVAILFLGMWFQERARLRQEQATPHQAGSPENSGDAYQPPEPVAPPLIEKPKGE